MQCKFFVLSHFLFAQLLDVLVTQYGSHNLCSGRHMSMNVCACAMPCLDTRCLFQQRVQERSLACTRSSRKRFPLYVRPWFCRQQIQHSVHKARCWIAEHADGAHRRETYNRELHCVCSTPLSSVFCVSHQNVAQSNS